MNRGSYSDYALSIVGNSIFINTVRIIACPYWKLQTVCFLLMLETNFIYTPLSQVVFKFLSWLVPPVFFWWGPWRSILTSHMHNNQLFHCMFQLSQSARYTCPLYTGIHCQTEIGLLSSVDLHLVCDCLHWWCNGCCKCSLYVWDMLN